MLQFIDPDSALRIDVFPTYGSTMSRTTRLDLPAGTIQLISLEDLVARAARLAQEIGLRMALGAHRNQIVRLVAGRGVFVAIVGIAIGVPAAFTVTRLMRNLLFGFTAFDPVVFIGVPLLLLVIAALASYVPARKAMRVDPRWRSDMSERRRQVNNCSSWLTCLPAIRPVPWWYLNSI